jgi:putative ABC transport system permease protein
MIYYDALLLLAFATALFALLPAAAIAATALLALATVLAVPLVFAAVLDVVGVLAVRLSRLTSLPVALASLRSTTLRSLALACTGAVALFGAVSLGGSRANLLSGIQRFSHNYVADAPIWVTSPDDNQAADEFVAGDAAARIARVPAVASVSDFYGGFLTLGSRRVWVIARPPGAARSVLASEIVDGDAQLSEARIDAGSIALSQKLAEALHARVGATLTLPTPSGLRLFRVVATTTNLAWPPGVIFMSAAAYARDWPSAGPTALGVGLRAGADPAAARAAIERALGGESGLEVSLARTRELRIDALTSEGLGQLAEISTLLLLAAIAAMAAALASSIWQRRSWLAGLRLSGAQPRRLRRVLLIEAALMLAAGCLTGALAGVYGQVVVDAYLARVTGFPLASAVMGVRPLEIFAVVLAVSLALASVPGWLASRVSPVLALRDE